MIAVACPALGLPLRESSLTNLRIANPNGVRSRHAVSPSGRRSCESRMQQRHGRSGNRNLLLPDVFSEAALGYAQDDKFP